MCVWADGDCHACMSASMQRFRVCLENIKTVAKLYSVQLPVVLTLWLIIHRNAALTVLSMIRGGGEGFRGDFSFPSAQQPCTVFLPYNIFQMSVQFSSAPSILLHPPFCPLHISTGSPLPPSFKSLPFLFVVFFNEVTQSVICCTVRAVQWRECQSYP